MKKTFELGTGIFGEGKPKICVPIVAGSRENIWKKAEEIKSLPADLVEWRVDFYEDPSRIQEVLFTLEGLKERLKEKGILFTFRTGREGGNRSIDKEYYYELNREAAFSGYVALVDMEAFWDEERTASEIPRIQDAGCRVIASNHDFLKTPDRAELFRRLKRMEELGADVAKLAVMPACREDVRNLLWATAEADRELHIPIVTMSMGHLGIISRLCGSLTGSAMTFAAAGEVSAPGQIGVDRMAEILELLDI